MTRAALLSLVLCLGYPCATHQARAAQLNYKLYVLGFPVADAVLGIDLATRAYRASLGFRTTGLADLATNGRLQQSASGRFEGDWPAPLEFNSNGSLRGQQRIVDLTWHDGNPIATTITPPNATEREDVPPILRAHTIDPLSMIVQLVALAARTGRCEGAAHGYDGRQLELFEARTAGEEDLPRSPRSSFSGHTLRCDFTDQTLAGFRFGSPPEEKLRMHQGTIWLSQVLPGAPRLPVRASIETRWLGDAMIYLTSVAP